MFQVFKLHIFDFFQFSFNFVHTRNCIPKTCQEEDEDNMHRYVVFMNIEKKGSIALHAIFSTINGFFSALAQMLLSEIQNSLKLALPYLTKRCLKYYLGR